MPCIRPCFLIMSANEFIPRTVWDCKSFECIIQQQFFDQCFPNTFITGIKKMLPIFICTDQGFNRQTIHCQTDTTIEQYGIASFLSALYSNSSLTKYPHDRQTQAQCFIQQKIYKCAISFYSCHLVTKFDSQNFHTLCFLK